MKTKLIKTVDGYELFTQGFLKGSTNYQLIDALNIEEGNIRYKLSIKNCQAIEQGYDLDELAWNQLGNNLAPSVGGYESFIRGFRKALELLGDKKFSEEDMLKISKFSQITAITDPSISTKELLKIFKERQLKQTEWDVEIEEHYVGECNGNDNNGCFSDSPGHNCGCYKKEFKLDSNGCLILVKL